MAGTKYAYVKNFELPDPLLPNTFIVLRVDGHAFHRFTDTHTFAKPNDERGLLLMDHAARAVMEEYKDIVLGFGESDEFSFLLRRSTSMYNRRESKILTTLVSHFTAFYIFYWSTYFPDTPLQYPPTFDGRLVLYPSQKEVKDYFAWRQADTHINNLYNTVFWALVQQGGQTTTEAHATLRGTISSQKHEILFTRFGVNYNALPSRYRKGSVLLREIDLGTEFVSHHSPLLENAHVAVNNSENTFPLDLVADSPGLGETNFRATKKRRKAVVQVLHDDIISDEFWEKRPMLLNGE
ncbi:hypothetical protein EW145_g3419 [Phellinidium pouzarii]|uniref:tRNA(His) guanylyltransferase n=1 Tax=Phellinidium pouzarii TaxID=167371 RepID=A0A4S4L7D8_9AGAM|nr:hypothetical protein EW145_g3419 [Phellinidium pouzarii]